MRFLHLLLAVVFFVPSVKSAFAAAPESAYDRVMRTGTLRCGYLAWPPLFVIDPRTGGKSGIWYDYTTEMAHQLNLKVEWAEEISTADFAAALKAGRVDAMCAPMGRLIPRFTGAAFTAPVASVEVKGYVRADDARFDEDLDLINTPDVRITSMEGEFNAVVARTRFPKAQLVEFPATLGGSQGFVNVATSKADIVFSDPLSAADYMKNNPGKLKAVVKEPLGIFGAGTAVAPTEMALLTMLDAATRSLVETGYIAALVHKYGVQEDVLIPVYPAAKAE